MISIREFTHRRERVAEIMQPNSLLVVSAARLVTRSRDTEFPFRQDSDFHYLSCFPEPDALILISNSDRFNGYHSALFCLEKDPLAEVWQGRRFGPDVAAESFDFDCAYELGDTEEKLLNYINGHQHLYFAQGQNAELDALLFTCLGALRDAPKQSKSPPASIIDSRILLHEMRLIKSGAEISVMREACAISASAHCRAMKFSKPGVFEYQLEAELHHEFTMRGAHYPAYGTIVGGGENACILHYTENKDELNAGDLVLIDAGGELHGYAADITRTFPVNGRFTFEQKALYNLVLAAQLASIDLFKPGNTLKQATDCAIDMITQGLLELGILSGDKEQNILEQSYRQYYMHGLSHWLGLDVHDVGDYKVDGQERVLQPGMVFTVEPGIYIAPDADVDVKWRGIGIRIEDNIVITESGHDVLTHGVPKTVEEIESLMTGQFTK